MHTVVNLKGKPYFLKSRFKTIAGIILNSEVTILKYSFNPVKHRLSDHIR